MASSYRIGGIRLQPVWNALRTDSPEVPFQELVVESAERQRVADCGVGRAGSPSRPVAGWQPGSRRAARRSAPTTFLQSRTRHPEFLAQVAEPQVLVNASFARRFCSV